ncbi:AraC family transcriptional regulator [Saccharibacillus sacchari]|uniref:AraC family transcriptional regulator n=1 Tax=Saccharibacillus sacchari TaxID=456493 RepID=A0ACC6PEF0_9BACL
MMPIDSISALHELLGCGKPAHPLITVIPFENIRTPENIATNALALDFYVISHKNNPDCELRYGRRSYDFREGSLIFTAPGQIMSGGGTYEGRTEGWMLCIHPDLIRGSSLWRKMPEYGFFEYESSEALHLSEAEKETVERLVENIRTEYGGNLDAHSRDLIVSNLELLLNYADRFYGRQFLTRTAVGKQAIVRFEELLDACFVADRIENCGVPSVKSLAQDMGYSPNYLSDMLKKETGKTAQEHIKLKLADLAEHLLLASGEPIYRISEKLGFEQPSSFTKFVKAQFGVSPVDYRKTRGVSSG